MTSYTILQAADRERIHDLAQRTLEETGIVVHYAPARQLLGSHGARVDEGRQLVRIPRRLIAQALATAPHVYTMHGHGGRSLVLGERGKYYTRTGTGLDWIVDFGSKQRRPVVGSDLRNWIRVADALGNVHMVGALYDQEGAPQAMDVRAVAGMLRGTHKPLMMSALSGEGMRWIKRLVEVVQPAASPHRVMVLSSVNSPLTYGYGQAEVAMVSAELGIPVVVNSSPVAGASSPVSMAGTVLQMHVEMLAAVTIVQLHRPGAAVMYAGHPLVMDMRTSTAAIGTPEDGLLSAASVEMAYHCGLPAGSDGLTSDSSTPDAMAVSDKWSSAFLPLLAGAHMNGAAGVFATQSTVSLEQLVIDDDIYGAMLRQVRGIAVDDEHLAIQEIQSAGPGGEFLTRDHTLAHYRSEVQYGRVHGRLSFASWEAQGARDILERARERVSGLLAAEASPVLDAQQERDVEALVAKAESALSHTSIPA